MVKIETNGILPSTFDILTLILWISRDPFTHQYESGQLEKDEKYINCYYIISFHFIRKWYKTHCATSFTYIISKLFYSEEGAKTTDLMSVENSQVRGGVSCLRILLSRLLHFFRYSEMQSENKSIGHEAYKSQRIEHDNSTGLPR